MTDTRARDALAALLHDLDLVVASDPQKGHSRERQRGWEEAIATVRSLAAGVQVDNPQTSTALREAAQAILDRCLDFFDEDDLDPESSFAMPVTLKARWIYALRAALAEETP